MFLLFFFLQLSGELSAASPDRLTMQSPGAGDGGKHVHPLPYGDVNQSCKSHSHVFSDVALMDPFFFFLDISFVCMLTVVS